jgi:hypothetical protein
MVFSEITFQALVQEIINALRGKAKGHLARIGPLNLELAEKLHARLCAYKEQDKSMHFEFYILGDTNTSSTITLDKAIEKRNQYISMCLLAPATINDKESSLKNTFQAFPLSFFLERIKKNLIEKLGTARYPEGAKPAVEQALKAAASLKVAQQSLETEIEYIEAALNNPKKAGAELWRIGLLPDWGKDGEGPFDFRNRLEKDNARLMKLLTKPRQTLKERLDACRLQSEFRNKLEKELKSFPDLLTDTAQWLQKLSTPELNLANWKFFTDSSEHELKRITLLKPRLGGNFSRAQSQALREEDGLLIAKVLPKKKIKIEWKSVPEKPKSVARWEIALIKESPEAYPEKSQGLQTDGEFNKEWTVAGNKFSYDVNLDKLDKIDFLQDENGKPKNFRGKFRVRALSSADDYFRNPETSEIIEDESDEIYFEFSETEEEEAETDKNITGIFPNLLRGYLAMAEKYEAPSFEHKNAAIKWEPEKSFSILTQNAGQGDSKRNIKVRISNFASFIEQRLLSAPEKLFLRDIKITDLRAKFSDLEPLIVLEDRQNQWEELAQSQAFTAFIEARKTVFNALKSKQIRPEENEKEQNSESLPPGKYCLAKTSWLADEELDNDLIEKTIAYAQKYKELLEWLISQSQFPQEAISSQSRLWLGRLLQIDTLSLELTYASHTAKALLVFPTHPCRLLWQAGYGALLNSWLLEIIQTDVRQRNYYHKPDEKWLAMLQPDNCPAFIPAALLADNLNFEFYTYYKTVGFFYGLYLHPQETNRERIASDIHTLLGYEPEEEIHPELQKIGDEIKNYYRYRYYLENTGIRLGFINPGNGENISPILEYVFLREEKNKSEEEAETNIKRIHFTGYAPKPLPFSLPGLRKFKEEFDYAKGKDNLSNPLLPALSVALREFEPEKDFLLSEEGENLTVYYNYLQPQFEVLEKNNAPTAFFPCYGLLNRWQKQITLEESSERYFCDYYLNTSLTSAQNYPKHPANPQITDTLLELTRVYFKALAFIANPKAQNGVAGMRTKLDTVFLRLLRQTDALLIADSFFPPELLDFPQNQELLAIYTPEPFEGVRQNLIACQKLSQSMLTPAAASLAYFGFNPEPQSLTKEGTPIPQTLKLLSPRLLNELIYETETTKREAILAVAFSLGFLLNQNLLQNKILLPTEALESDTLLSETKKEQDNNKEPWRPSYFILHFEESGFISLEIVRALSDRGQNLAILEEEEAEKANALKKAYENLYFNPQYQEQDLLQFHREKLATLAALYLQRSERYGLISPQNYQKLQKGILQMLEGSQSGYSLSARIIFVGKNFSQKDKEQQNIHYVQSNNLQWSLPTPPPPKVSISLSPYSNPAEKDGEEENENDEDNGNDDFILPDWPNEERDPGALLSSAPALEKDENEKQEQTTPQRQKENTPSLQYPQNAAATPLFTSENDKTEEIVIASVELEPISFENLLLQIENLDQEKTPPAAGQARKQFELELMPNYEEETPQTAPTPQFSLSLSFNKRPEKINYPSGVNDAKIKLGFDRNNEAVYWQPNIQGSPNLLILGMPGQGKSSTLRTVLDQLKRQGIGAIVIDYNQDFCSPSSSFYQAYQPKVWKPLEGLAFSPFELSLEEVKSEEKRTLVYQKIVDIFDYVFVLGVQQRNRLKKAIEKAYADALSRDRLPSVKDLKRIIQNAPDYQTLEGRLDVFLDIDFFQPTENSINWLEEASSGLVIDFSELANQEKITKLICAFLFRKIYLDLKMTPSASGIRLFVVVDEAHKVAKDESLTLIIKELRKYGVGALLASQDIDDFEDKIINNVGSKIIFRTNAPASKKAAKLLDSSDKTQNLQGIIENLTSGTALARTEKMTKAEKIKTLKMHEG